MIFNQTVSKHSRRAASFLLMAMAMLLPGSPTAYSQSRQPQADELRATLKKGMTQKDSLNILFDVYDLSDQKRKPEIGWLILDVAERAKDYEVLYDMLPQMSSLIISDLDVQDKLIERAKRLPEGNNKKAVESYLAINKVVIEGSYLSPEERQIRLKEYLREEMTPKNDIYQDFLDLYRVVVFLGVSNDGGMYMEYLQRLEKMIDKVPEAGFAFPSRFYTTAANYYTRNDFHHQAVEMDRKTLALIADLEKYYKSQGRRYRNYDRFKYLAYRRMLSNHQALSDKEVDDLYAKCKALAEQSDEIKRDFYKYRLVDAYYMMAKGRYADAVPALQEALRHVDTRSTRFGLLSRLKAAADSTHNKEALIDAYSEYTHMLEEKMRSNSENTMLELKTRYEVRELEEARREAENEKVKVEMESKEKLISIALVALFVMAVVLMLLYRSHFKLIHRSRDLKADNDKLRQSIEEILYDGNIPGSEALPQVDHPAGENHPSKGEDSGKKGE